MGCIENARKEMLDKAKTYFKGPKATNTTFVGNSAVITYGVNQRVKTRESAIGQAYSNMRRVEKNLTKDYSINLAKGWTTLNTSYPNEIRVDIKVPIFVNKALEVKFSGKSLNQANEELSTSNVNYIGENQYEFEGEVYPTEDDIYYQANNINYLLKSISILQSDKAKQIFAKGEKAKWDLNKILTELAIPKEQKQIILDKGFRVLTNNDARILKKPDVILPIGTSGSGKSTFIKSLPQKNLVVIEPDVMRVEFTGDMNNKSKDKEIYEEAANRAIDTVKQGKQVVFDTTNLTKDKRLPFIEAIKKAIPTANIQYKLMELNPELAKQRIKADIAAGKNRANVPDDTIDRHAESYKQMLEDIKNEPISNIEEEPNDNLREEIIISLLAENSFVVEVNVAKGTKVEKPIGAVYNNEDGWQPEDFEESIIDIDNPTQYYSNLTVPGGTNYTENEISTPLITPSIKGHAEFSTDQGIGWFRSDDKVISQMEKREMWSPYTESVEEYEEERGSVDPIKTRRILELQSDLFQKGRDKKDLVDFTTTEPATKQEFKNAKLNGKVIYSGRDGEKGVEYNNVTYNREIHVDYEDGGSWESYNKVSLEKKIELNNNNQFLQLLNKNNNWVTFFIKTIIQDSAKQGYEKVLFPKGDTLIKIESAGNYNSIENAKNANEENLVNTALFYEIKVGNILEKQFGKDNIKTVTDEYGNQWREITIDKQRDLSNILLQKKATKSRDKELDAKLTEFANNLDIDIRDNLKNIKDKSGNTIDVVAKADLLNKVIEINDGKAGKDTLTEEVVHFATSMLKDKKVIQSLHEDIVNHDIYDEVVAEYGEIYKNDDAKLRKEATDKLITQELIDLYESKIQDQPSKYPKFVKAFLDLLNKIFKFTTAKQYRETVNPYQEIAEAILRNDVDQFNSEASGTTEEFYQSRNSSKAMEILTQKDVVDKLNTISSNINKSDRNYFNNKTNKQIQRTVDDIVKDASRKLGLKGSNTLGMLKGSTISMYNGYISDSLINGKIPTQKEATEYVYELTKDNELFKSGIKQISDTLTIPGFIAISESNFNELVEGIDSIIKDIKENQLQLDPNGTVELRSEQTVYNEANDTAGTIDLLAVYSDASMGIYEFTTNKENTDSYGNIASLSNNRRDIATAKITSGLSSILTESIGNIQFRQLRLVPINTQYGHNGFKKIEMATKNNPSEYLDHIPLEGEITGYATLDKLVDRIHKQKAEINASGIDKIKKNIKLKELDKVIQTLLYKKDVVLFGKKIRYLNEQILTRLGSSQDIPEYITNEELRAYKHHLDNFESIDVLYDDLVKLDSKNAKDEYRKALNYHAGEFRKLKIAINAELTQRAENTTGVDLTQPSKSISTFQALFGGLASFDNNIFKAINSLIRQANERTRNETRDFNVKLKDATDNLAKYAKSQSKSLKDMYELLMDNGNFIEKVDKAKFYDARNKAIKDNDIKWFKDNTIYRKEEFDKKANEYWESLNNPTVSYILTNDSLSPEEQQAQIKEHFEEWEQKYNVEKYPRAYMNPKNTFYVVANTEINTYNTAKYNAISNIPQIKQFYDTYTDFMNEAIDIVGSDKLKGNFIPNYSQNILESFGEKGLTGLINIGRSLRQSFVVQENDDLRGVVGVDGKQSLTIPVYGISPLYQEPSSSEVSIIEAEVATEFTRDTPEFNNEVDRRKKVLGFELGETVKSLDLAKSLSIFSEQVYNYKNMTDIETTALVYKDTIDGDKLEYLTTDAFGRNLKKWQTGLLQKQFNVPASTKDLFDKVIRREIYGQKIQGNKSTFDINGTTYDWAKVFQTASNYMTVKSLALNPVLGISNYVGAKVNLAAHYREGIHFTKQGYKAGIEGLISSDPKVKAMLGFFEPSSRDLNYDRATNLSASKLVKNLTLSNLMYFHKVGDDNIDKGILIGMSKHYVVDSDGLIKNPKTDNLTNKNAPTVYDSMNITNDKITINGLKKNTSEQEYNKFRAKVQRISYLTKGSMGVEQEMLGNTSIMFRAVMKFRSWMPGLITTRFDKLKYDSTLELYNEGRLRAVWGDVVGGKAVDSLKSFGGLLAEVAAFGLYSKGINNEALKSKYDRFISANPETKFTFDEFVNWYKPLLEAKLRGTAFELRALLSLIGLVSLTGLMGWDDDEENGLFSLYAYNIIRRSALELSFFYDKGSAQEILKSPIPMMSLVNDLSAIFTNAVDEAIAPGEDGNPMLYYTLKSIPVQNQIFTAFDFWDKN